MAGITIKMNLEDSGSIVKKTNDTKNLNKELEKTTRLASQALAQPKGAAFVAAETQEYGRGRAAVGTGAAARDFANQAQGLGGLVRLYATYAANLFAATAAFNALREAMNTDMMVRGLDQLGAASGVALGGLAKQFVQVTDGAISLRESMEATTKAISSGLSTAQFLELGKVAKGASQALGVNMSDAVSRLTRGITKLEPELLDELGIFTKVGQAAEQYAKSVGKSVTSLTDFERRQAFANAVLEEGRQKFGEIAMEGNPYDKLLANLKNVAQDILSVVNGVVAPIAKLLADNIGLIGLAIAAAGVKIVNQALPAIRSWQDGLKDAAQAAKARALEVSESFGSEWVIREEARQNIPKLKSTEAEQLRERQTIEAQRAKTASELDKKQLGYRDNAKTLAALTKTTALTEQEINGLLVQRTKLEGASTDKQKAQLAAIEARLALEKQSLGVQQAIAATRQKIDTAYNVVGAKSEKESFDDVLRRRITQQAVAEDTRLGILSKVSENVERKGFSTALGELYSETTASKDLSRIQKFRTVASGAISAIATQAGLIFSAAGGILSGIQTAIVAFTVLDSVFSTNSKQASAFSTELDNLSENLKTVDSTAKKFATNPTTLEGVNALSASFIGLSDSVSNSVQKFNELQKASSTWDKLVDLGKDALGFGSQDVLSEALAKSVEASFKNLPENELKSTLQIRLKDILGGVRLEEIFVKDFLKGLSTQEFGTITKDLVAALNDAKPALQSYQKTVSELKASSSDFETALASLRSSAAVKDPTSGFATSQLNSLLAYQTALKSTVTVLGALNELSKESSATIAARFGNEAQAINSALTSYRELDLQLDTYNKRIQQAEKQIEAIGKSGMAFVDTGVAQEELRLRKFISNTKQGVRDLQTEMGKLGSQIASNIEKELSVRAQAAISNTKNELAKIGIQERKSVLEALPFKTEESIKEGLALELQSISVQKELQKSNNNLVSAINRLTLEFENERLSREASGPDSDKVLRDTNRGLIATNREAIRLMSSGSQEEIKNFLTQNPRLASLFQPNQANRIVEASAESSRRQARMRADVELAAVRIDRADELLRQQEDELTRRLQAQKAVPQAQQLADPQAYGSALKVLQDSLDEVRQQRQLLQGSRELDTLSVLRRYGLSEGVSQEATARAITRRSGAVAQAGSTEAADTVRAKAIDAQAEYNKLFNERFSKEALSLQIQKDQSSLEKQRLDIELARGQISQKDYDLRLNALKIADIETDKQLKLTDLKNQETEAQSKLNQLIKESAESGAPLSQADIDAKKQGITAVFEASRSAIISGADLQKQSLRDLTDQEKAFKNLASVVEKAFEGMGDALADFVLTGKGNFKDLVNSILTDLLRLEMRRSFTSLLDSLGGGAGIVKSILGAFTPAATPIVGAPVDSAIIGGPARAARGAAFDEGLMRFAKGGAFTNEVVNTPTQFKFAQGAGVMGEAGPEAIMPLARDSSGNLGVRANGGGGNVEVVVNNYTTEKAEARETVDSRGNRRIEVVVGEMVASEVTRSNSAVNRSIRGSFATQPNLIRR